MCPELVVLTIVIVFELTYCEMGLGEVTPGRGIFGVSPSFAGGAPGALIPCCFKSLNAFCAEHSVCCFITYLCGVPCCPCCKQNSLLAYPASLTSQAAREPCQFEQTRHHASRPPCRIYAPPSRSPKWSSSALLALSSFPDRHSETDRRCAPKK